MIRRWTADGKLSAEVAPHATTLHGAHSLVQAYDGMEAGAQIGPEPAEKRKKRGWGGRVAWLVALVTVGVLLGLAVITVLKFVDGPVSSKPGVTAAKMVAVPSAAPTASMWAGKYAELKYPGVFNQLGHASGSARTLEAYNLSSRGNYERQVSINVSQLPSGSLDDDSSYAFRRNQPSAYTKEVLTLKGEPVVKMTKTDKTEIGLFWVHDRKLLMVMATTSNPSKDNLGAYLAQIQPTIHWRQL
jgi:hypothetical protein